MSNLSLKRFFSFTPQQTQRPFDHEEQFSMPKTPDHRSYVNSLNLDDEDSLKDLTQKSRAYSMDLSQDETLSGQLNANSQMDAKSDWRMKIDGFRRSLFNSTNSGSSGVNVDGFVKDTFLE